MLVVNPNLCIDRTIRLKELLPGHVLRPHSGLETAGGKGVNVARVARAHGRSADIVGFVPSRDGHRLAELLAAEGGTLIAVPAVGSVRVASVLLEDGGRVTVLNEPGPFLAEADLELLLDAVRSALRRIAARRLGSGGTVLACSGSLPPGLPTDTYGRLTRVAHAAGARIVVDAAREALAQALPVGPDVVTPNLAEAEGLLQGQAAETVDVDPETARVRAQDAVRALCAAGARRAVVTAGAAGVAAGDAHTVSWVPTIPVDVVSPVGAGDSFVGGLAMALEDGDDWPDAVQRGVAVAAASCEQELAGGVDPVRAAQLLAILRGMVQ